MISLPGIIDLLPPSVLYGLGAASGLLFLFLLWRKFGRGPVRRRGFRLARTHLREGRPADGLAQVRGLRHLGKPSRAWVKRFDALEAECRQALADNHLRERSFDKALEEGLQVAALTGASPAETRLRIQEAMLAEVRRLFGQSRLGETRALLDLIARTLDVHAPCREASFWQGLTHLRGGETDKALAALETARSGDSRPGIPDEALRPGFAEGDGGPPAKPLSSFIDPSLYLGALLLRRGQAREALLLLTEANRIDGTCPMVTILLGSGLVASGGDLNLAIRALQRALQRLQQWEEQPQRAWVEGFPEGRSYVRKLAQEHPFLCPVFADLQFLARQGMLALAQALYKQGDYAEAARLFEKVLAEGAPSLQVVRGLGLSLVRVGRYDDAFKHLRAALEMEDPRERETAGFLALCGAKGTPPRPEDRRRNIDWAIRTLTEFTAPGDAEWVALVSAVFEEARDADLPLSQDDQLYLCEHLASVQACDPLAAQAFLHLQATFPQAVQPEYAWLTCKAAQMHPIDGPNLLALFERTFATREQAEAYFQQQGWDFPAVERAFLEKAAALAPGRFPPVLGHDYAPRGEALLLEWADSHERDQRLEETARTLQVLVQLDPGNQRVFDRLARLHHRRGEEDRALELLEEWSRAHPNAPLPLVRQALLLRVLHRESEGLERIQQALALAQGREKGKIALLAARLALASGSDDPEGLARPRALLDTALAEAPDLDEACWLLGLVLWKQGDRAALARLRPRLDRPDQGDPRWQMVFALSALAEQDFPAVLAAADRMRVHPTPTLLGNDRMVSWAAEADYLKGTALLESGQEIEACLPLRQVAETDCLSAPAARAWLGTLAFRNARYEEAADWWKELDQDRRKAWRLGETLAAAMFLAALADFRSDRFEEAADRLRQAGKLGCRDRRLGPLLVQALFRAGQKLVYAGMG